MGEFHPGSDSDVGQHSGFRGAALHGFPDPSDGRQDAAAGWDGPVWRPHSPPARRGSFLALRPRRPQNRPGTGRGKRALGAKGRRKKWRKKKKTE